MKRIPTVLIYAVIGAIAGGVLASLLAFLVNRGLSPERLLGEALRSLGIAGVIGGALGAILYGIVGRRVAHVVVAGLCGGLMCCVLMPFAAVVYYSNPWPSPQPYPGSDVSVDISQGSSHAGRTREYTIGLRPNEVQAYYSEQMAKYCVGEWQFGPAVWCSEEACREATCRIRRLWLEQFFMVTLIPVSDQVTKVRQVDSWEY